MLKKLKQFDMQVEKVVGWVLLLAVAMMFSLSVLNILLRWMNTTIHWVEPFVRHLVFLCTFLGGVIATGRGTHIGIDILGRWCESNHKAFLFLWIRRITALTSLLTVLWLIKSSVDFMKMELEYGKEVFWGLSSGHLVGIIPVGFALIALRFLVVLILTAETPTSNTSGVNA